MTFFISRRTAPLCQGVEGSPRKKKLDDREQEPLPANMYIHICINVEDLYVTLWKPAAICPKTHTHIKMPKNNVRRARLSAGACDEPWRRVLSRDAEGYRLDRRGQPVCSDSHRKCPPPAPCPQPPPPSILLNSRCRLWWSRVYSIRIELAKR